MPVRRRVFHNAWMEGFRVLGPFFTRFRHCGRWRCRQMLDFRRASDKVRVPLRHGFGDAAAWECGRRQHIEKVGPSLRGASPAKAAPESIGGDWFRHGRHEAGSKPWSPRHAKQGYRQVNWQEELPERSGARHGCLIAPGCRPRIFPAPRFGINPGECASARSRYGRS